MSGERTTPASSEVSVSVRAFLPAAKLSAYSREGPSGAKPCRLLAPPSTTSSGFTQLPSLLTKNDGAAPAARMRAYFRLKSRAVRALLMHSAVINTRAY